MVWSLPPDTNQRLNGGASASSERQFLARVGVDTRSALMTARCAGDVLAVCIARRLCTTDRLSLSTGLGQSMHVDSAVHMSWRLAHDNDGVPPMPGREGRQGHDVMHAPFTCRVDQIYRPSIPHPMMASGTCWGAKGKAEGQVPCLDACPLSVS